VLVDEGKNLAASLGENAVFLRHDVSREDDWEAAVNLATERYGSLDVLVNNAGILHNATIAKHTLADYERVVAVNQVGVFLGIRSAIAPMTSRGGGSIVNISSGAGIRATKYGFAYAATKYAVTGMTAAAALELARNNIRVNSIHPGLIDTPMVASDDPNANNKLIRATPLRRAGQPEEIARVALFLASDESSYMTGAHVPVDGGVTA
jgi:3alpha(or 20beta)-hydroxysteroid dehydrogenase